MIRIYILIALLSTTFVAKGQNLVPNGDFEGYSGCPTGLAQLDSALFWINPATNIFGISGTPDYYNSCASVFSIDVPNNWGGYQAAHSGLAYCGISLWYDSSMAATYSNFREYIEAPLTSPLIANQCYRFEMYCNLPNACKYSTDAIGIYFSDVIINGINNYFPLPFVPQINNTVGNYPDTLNWTLVSGNYIANGGESYLIIGNYYDDINTNILIVDSNGAPHTYVFIDDVSLVQIPPCNTSIEEHNQQNQITIYPNPAGEELHVQSLKFKVGDEIKVYDVMGKEVLKSAINLQSSTFNIKSLQSGIYFIEINGVRKKFVKQ